VVLVHTQERLTLKRLVRLTDDGRCWVEGDNAAASTDSRTYGAVPREDVVGEVRWRYYPWSRAGRVR
jgi:inner membrane protease subunit 2